MEENRKKLEIWEESIASYEKENLKKFKEMYREYEQETNKSKKNEIRKGMIEKTLYKVCEFIKKSGFMYLTSSKFDMDDVIMTSCELWIHLIDDGTIAKKKTFTEVLFRTFYDRLIIELNGQYPLNQAFGFSKGNINNCLEYFINNENDIDYNEFEKLIAVSTFGKTRKNLVEEEIQRIYDLINCIYMENIEYEEGCIFDIAKTFRELFIPILVDNSYLISLEQLREREEQEEEMEDIDIESALIETEQLEQRVIKMDVENLIFKSEKLSKKQKVVLYYYYIKELRKNKIAEYLGDSKMNITYLEKKVFCKVRKSFTDYNYRKLCYYSQFYKEISTNMIFFY